MNDKAFSVPFTDSDGSYAYDIRRSVREAALVRPLSNSECSQDKSSDDGSEHFFIPLSSVTSMKEVEAMPNRRKQRLVFSPPEIRVPKSTKDFHLNTGVLSSSTHKLNGFDGYDGNPASLIRPGTGNEQSLFPDADDALDQVFSPPLLLDSSFFQDTYEDLLGMFFLHYLKLSWIRLEYQLIIFDKINSLLRTKAANNFVLKI